MRPSAFWPQIQSIAMDGAQLQAWVVARGLKIWRLPTRIASWYRQVNRTSELGRVAARHRPIAQPIWPLRAPQRVATHLVSLQNGGFPRNWLSFWVMIRIALARQHGWLSSAELAPRLRADIGTMNRPNILLVSFDDAVAPWPYKTAFGEPLQTPNLDRLCAVSTAFHSAYAQAPICGPSRASMMTAKMPPELGILDNSTFVFDKVAPQMVWSYLLKQSGYFCSSGGKVHHRYKPLRPVHHHELYSDERKTFSDDMGLPRELRKRVKRYGGNRNGRATLDGSDDAFYYDAQSAEFAIRFLTDFTGDQPFYREVGFYSPHVPHLTPARFKEMYDVSNFKRPIDWTGYIHDNAYVSATLPEKEELRSEDWWRKSVRNYYSAYSHGDHHLGRVLDALAASPHAADTVVIVISDHGFHLGNRNLFRKSTMWEQSLRIPLIVYDPASPIGQVVEDPVALMTSGRP